MYTTIIMKIKKEIKGFIGLRFEIIYKLDRVLILLMKKGSNLVWESVVKKMIKFENIEEVDNFDFNNIFIEIFDEYKRKMYIENSIKEKVDVIMNSEIDFSDELEIQNEEENDYS